VCADVAPHALCATQRRVEQIQWVVALGIIAGGGRGGMNPQVLSSLDLTPIDSWYHVFSHSVLQGDNVPYLIQFRSLFGVPLLGFWCRLTRDLAETACLLRQEFQADRRLSVLALHEWVPRA
jgi:hypothetical protein